MANRQMRGTPTRPRRRRGCAVHHRRAFVYCSLMGVEYIVPAEKLMALNLPKEELSLWHSHVYGAYRSPHSLTADDAGDAPHRANWALATVARFHRGEKGTARSVAAAQTS